MANIDANNSTSGYGNNSEDSGAARSWKTLRKLMEDNVFNCESCGMFFKTAVYCVFDAGIVCQTCLDANQWQGRRLKFFDTALQDLPVVPCTNADAGCVLQVLPEDLKVHLEHCKYRLVDCISPGCSWQNKQDDLAKHFEETHQVDVINEETTNSLDIAQEHFVVAKLLIKNDAKYFLVIRRELNSNHLLYDAFNVEKGNIHKVTVRHFCDDIEDYTKQIETKELNLIDKNKTYHSSKIRWTILKEMSEGRNGLFFTAKVEKNNSEELLNCSGCGKTMRRPIYQCQGKHGVCDSCFSNLSQCPVCQGRINRETGSASLEALTSDVYYSCANQHLGCRARLLGNKMDQHESKCAYAVYHCPIPKCSYTNSSDESFKQHVSKHRGVLQENEHEFVLNLKNERPQTSYMNFNNCLFEVGAIVELASCKYIVINNCNALRGTYNVEFTVQLLSSNQSNYLCNIIFSQILHHHIGVSSMDTTCIFDKDFLITKNNKTACKYLCIVERDLSPCPSIELIYKVRLALANKKM